MVLKLSKILEDFWGALIGAVFAAGTWLVRRVLTNQRQIAEMQIAHRAQIEMIRADMAHHDQVRTEDREHLNDVKRDVREIRDAILDKGKR